MEAVGDVLRSDPRIAYGLVFGSMARGRAHAGSDLDVAIELAEGVRLSTLEVGGLVSDLERATGRTVDLVVLSEAPVALAYRVFRDGQVVFERDHTAFVNRKAKAILEYLDFKPFEDVFVRGILQPRG